LITENLSTLKIHKLTKEQYDRELNAGRIDENAIYLTPDNGGDSGIYIGSGEMPEGYNVQIDPNGDTLEAEDIYGHIEDKNNPHEVTAEQIGAAKQEDLEKLDMSIEENYDAFFERITGSLLDNGIVPEITEIVDGYRQGIVITSANMAEWITICKEYTINDGDGYGLMVGGIELPFNITDINKTYVQVVLKKVDYGARIEYFQLEEDSRGPEYGWYLWVQLAGESIPENAKIYPELSIQVIQWEG
jgi:hypothetical protein